MPALPLTTSTMGVMVASIVPSSAAAALSLLEEPESELQSHALRSLNVLADVFWPEISSAVPKIQEMSEDSTFIDKSLAALVAAKVLFHLGELDEALVYALSAGDKFDVAADTEFAKTLRSRCIDDYTEQMAAEEAESTAAAATAATMGNGIAEESVLPRKQLQSEMKAVFERVLEECITSGRVREAIGVSLDARRLDCVEAAITRGCKEPQERADALAYCFSCAQVCFPPWCGGGLTAWSTRCRGLRFPLRWGFVLVATAACRRRSIVRMCTNTTLTFLFCALMPSTSLLLSFV